MRARDYTDLIGGSLLLIFGLWFAYYAGQEYDLGTLRRMGPGFFPVSLGYLVAAMGLLVLLPALFREGGLPQPRFRPFITIIIGGLVFAFIVERLGLVPATVALVVISALAEERFRPVRTAILAVVLSVMAVSIFTYGLGIPIPAFAGMR